jgi:hypothetical protein
MKEERVRSHSNRNIVVRIPMASVSTIGLLTARTVAPMLGGVVLAAVDKEEKELCTEARKAVAAPAGDGDGDGERVDTARPDPELRGDDAVAAATAALLGELVGAAEVKLTIDIDAIQSPPPRSVATNDIVHRSTISTSADSPATAKKR